MRKTFEQTATSIAFLFVFNQSYGILRVAVGGTLVDDGKVLMKPRIVGMNSRLLCSLKIAAYAVLFLACGNGCGSKQNAIDEPAQAHMKVLGLLYGMHQSEYGAPPASQEKFIAYLQKSPENWSKIAPSADQFLASVRDGSPLVVIYGKPPKSATVSEPWIAYESNAVDGEHLLTNAFGHVESVSEEEFNQLIPKS
ncbi:hypothetical protein [Lacipirellula sp.]|uniref:hypothetical protein n=1 Tax=Lacipirellula sp. TaxID=2691419 RepID=UPI003D0E85A8